MSVEAYWKNLSILSGASVGIIVTRTREPYRCHEELRNYVAATNIDRKAKNDKPFEYRLWTVTEGWSNFNLEDPAQPAEITEGSSEPVEAISMIHTGSTPFGGTGRPGDEKGGGFYAMMFSHYFWTEGGKVRNPAFTQRLLAYSRDFTDTRCKKRLILIVPMDFEVPPEIQDVVAMLDFETPTREELLPTVSEVITSLPADRRPNYTDADVDRIVTLGAGMTAMEFENAMSRAFVAHREALPDLNIDRMCDMLAEVKTEVVKRSDVLELIPAIDMSEVGGLDELKDWITECAPAFTQEAREAGVDAPKGVALAGPPGTGKSLVAKAISSSLMLPLIRFDVSRVFNSLVGASESRVRTAAKLVEAMAPCVCFIDEADKAFNQSSGGGDSGVGQRVLGSILTWMNDSTSGVFFVFTMNRTEGMPAELLRKGRLDEVFSVTVPSEDERQAIFAIHLLKRKVDPASVKDLDVAIQAASGYVPAEMEAAVKEAKKRAFFLQHTGKGDGKVTGAMIAEQLKVMKPLSEAFKEQFDKMAQWAENNARPASRTLAQNQAKAQVRQRSRGPALAPSGTIKPTRSLADG